jgi:hypothetical protein
MHASLLITYDGTPHREPEDILQVTDHPTHTTYLIQKEGRLALFVVIKFVKDLKTLSLMVDTILLGDSVEIKTKKDSMLQSLYLWDAVGRFFDLDSTTFMTEFLKEIDSVEDITFYFEHPLAYSMLMTALSTNVDARSLILSSLITNRLYREYILPVERKTRTSCEYSIAFVHPIWSYPLGSDILTIPTIEGFDVGCRQVLEAVSRTDRR